MAKSSGSIPEEVGLVSLQKEIFIKYHRGDERITESSSATGEARKLMMWFAV